MPHPAVTAATGQPPPESGSARPGTRRGARRRAPRFAARCMTGSWRCQAQVELAQPCTPARAPAGRPPSRRDSRSRSRARSASSYAPNRPSLGGLGTVRRYDRRLPRGCHIGRRRPRQTRQGGCENRSETSVSMHPGSIGRNVTPLGVTFRFEHRLAMRTNPIAGPFPCCDMWQSAVPANTTNAIATACPESHRR